MLDNLDKKIEQIQKSTRTSSNLLAPLHDRLRLRYSWYYKWHLNPISKFIHLLTLSFYVIGIGLFAINYINGPYLQTSKAASAVTTLTFASPITVTNPAGSTSAKAQYGNNATPTSNAVTTGTEVSTANYVSISTAGDSDVYSNTAAPSSGYPYQIYRYYIDPAVTNKLNITKFDFTHVGYGMRNTVAFAARTIMVRNLNTSAWVQLSTDSNSSSTSTTNTINISNNIGYYVDSSNYIYFMVYGPAAATYGSNLYTDQAKLAVTAVVPPVAPTITSPNGGESWNNTTQNVTWTNNESGRSTQIEASNLTQYDNFNDDTLNTGLWTKTEGNGVTVSETGNELQISGTAAAAQTTYVDSTAAAISTSSVFQTKFKASTNPAASSQYAFVLDNSDDTRRLALSYQGTSNTWSFDYYNGSTSTNIATGVTVGAESTEYKTIKIVYDAIDGYHSAYVYDANGTEHFIGQIGTAVTNRDMTVGSTKSILGRYRAIVASGTAGDARFDDYMVYPVNNIGNDNIDSYAAGSSINGKGSWATGGETTYGTANISNAQYVSSANSLALVKNTTSGTLRAQMNYSAQTGNIIGEWDMRAAQTTGWFQYSLRNGGGTTASVAFGSDGNIYAYNGTTNTILQTYAANTWYHAKVVADTQRQKYDVYVNGVLKASNYSFYGAQTSINDFYFDTSGTVSSTAYVDNVQVYSEFKPVCALTSADATSYSWNLNSWSAGTNYLVRARTYDSSSNLFSAYDYSDSAFTIVNVIPDTPSISSPTSNATNVALNPTITSSAYSGPESQVSASWEIYDNSSLAAGNLVWSKSGDTTNLASIDVNDSNGTFSNSLSGKTALAEGTNYWVRVKHTNADADSVWSNAIQFTTQWITLNVSGTIYTADDKSSNVGSSQTLALAINGGAPTTVTTGSNGSYRFSNITANANDLFTIYLSGDASKANAVSQFSATVGMVSLDLYVNKVVVSHDTAGPMTNAMLATAYRADSDIIYSISGSDITIGASYELFIPTGKTYTPGGNVTTGGLQVSGTGVFNSAANSVTVSGNWKIPATATFTSTGTTTFNGSGTQTLAAGGADSNHQFGNIISSNSGTLQLVTSGLKVTSTLTIGASTTLDLNGQALTAGTLSNGNWMRLTGDEAVAITTFDSTHGTVEYYATSGTRSIKNFTYNNLKINGTGGTFTLSASTTVNGNLDVTAGTLNTSNGTVYNLIVAGNATLAGTLTANSSTITVSGNWDSSAGTFTYGTSTVIFNNTNSINTKTDASWPSNFYNLTMASAGKTNTLLQLVTVANVCTLGTGTITSDSSAWLALRMNGGTPLVNSGATINTSRIVYIPTSGTDVVAAGNYGTAELEMFNSPGTSALTFNQAGAVTAGLLKFVSHPSNTITYNTQNYGLTVSGISYGDTSYYTGADTLNLGSSIVNVGTDGISVDSNGGTHTLSMGTSTINISGDWKMANGTGNIILSSGIGQTVVCNSSSTQIITTNNRSFYNLTHSGDGTLLLATNNLAVSNNFVNSAGTFDASGKNVTIGASLANSATLTMGSGTWTNNGITNFTAGTVSANSATINSYGNFTVSGGTFDKGTSTLNMSGTASLSMGGQSLNNLHVGTIAASTPDSLWTMNDNAASSTVLDSSGNGINGTFYANGAAVNTSTRTVAGVISTGLNFLTSSKHYVLFPYDANKQNFGAGSFSVSLWLKPTDTGDYRAITQWSTSTYGWLMEINPSGAGGLRFKIQDASAHTVDYTVAAGITAGTWQLVTATIDRTNNEMKLYVNNNQVGTVQNISGVGVLTPATNVDVGHIVGDASQYYNGSVDDIRMFKKVLSYAEIKQLYAKYPAGNITVADNTTVTGTLTTDASQTLSINSGKTVSMAAGSTTTNNGIIAGSGTLELTDSAGANLSTGGTLSSVTRFATASSNISVPARTYGGSVELYNNSSSNYTATLGTATSQTLTFSGNFTPIANSTGNITVDASTYNPTLNISGNIGFTKGNSGTLTLNGGNSTWNIGGNVDFSNGTFNSGTSTLNLNSSTAGQSFNSAGQSLYNLTSSNSYATGVTFGDSAMVTGTFTNITGGSHLTFHAGSTYAFANININGSGSNIIMRSSADNSQWLFNVAASTPTVTNVDVKDSDASGGNTIHVVSCVNNGNNVNWIFNQTPSVPDTLAPAAFVDGSWQTNTTPTLSFNLSDPDSGDTVKYQIKVSPNSDFSSPVIDYTSALGSQGGASFTIGQAAGSGTYTTGSQNQTLSDGQYYWEVKAIDNSGASSSYAIAGNSNTSDIKLDTANPTTDIAINPSSPTGNNSYYKGSSPSITLSASDATSGVAAIYYRFGSTGEYTQYSTSLTAPEGDNTIYYYSTDNAGNSSSSSPITREIKVDTALPTVSSTIDPSSPNGQNSYYTAAPAITLSALDTGGSGIASIQYHFDSDSDQAYSSAITDNLEGTHTLYFHSVDNAGNVGATSSTNIKLDTQTPTTDIYLDPSSPTGNNSYYKGSAPAITFTSLDSTSGASTIYYKWGIGGSYQAYSGSALTAGEGDNTIYYYGTDNAGNTNQSSPFSREIKVDTITPTATASAPAPNGSNNYYIGSAPTVTLSADDGSGSGISSIMYKWDSDSYQAYSTGLTAPDGTHTLYYYATDNAGNTGVSSPNSTTYNVETSAPSVTLTTDPTNPNGNNSYYITSAPTVTLSATDPESGIASIKYHWDSNADQVYSTPFTAPEGTHTITYYSVSNAGTQSDSTTQTIKVDTSLPTTDIYINPSSPDGSAGYYKSVPSITFSATDSGSGLNHIYYRFGNTGEYTQYTSAINVEEGDNTIYYYATDNAGNTNQSSPVSREFKVDTIATPVTITLDPSSPNGSAGYYTSSPAITLSATDTNGSGVSSIQYKWDSGSYQVYGSALTAPEGTHTLYTYFTDNAGNSSPQSSQTVKLDTEISTTDIFVNPASPNGNDSYYTSSPTITFSAIDTNSGVSTIYYKWDDAADYTAYTTAITASLEGTHTIYYYSSDNAGNTGASTPISRQFKLDTIVPTVSMTTDPATPNGANGYFITAPDITLSAADTNGSGITSILYKWDNAGSYSVYSTPLTDDQEGSHTLSYYSIDAAGNQSSPASYTFKLDNIAPIPVAYLNPSSPNGTNSYYKDSAPTVIFTSDDGSGSGYSVIYYRFGTTGDYHAYAGSPVAVPEGIDTLQYYGTDLAGNSGIASPEELTVKVDTTLPNVAATLAPATPNGQSNYYTSSPTVTLTASDTDSSGISAIKYKWDNGAYATYTDAIAANLEGVHTISYYSIDNAGNASNTSTKTINLDTQAPSATDIHFDPAAANGDNGYYKGSSPAITFTATDTNSGVGTIYYKWGTDGSYQEYNNSTPLTAPEGDSTIYYYSTDRAGNSNVANPISRDIKLDTTAPTVSALVDPATPDLDGYYTVTNPTITLSGSDNDGGSGLASIQYKWDDDNFAPYNTPVITETLTDGTHTLSYRSLDNAGNISETKNLSIQIDRNAPDMSNVIPGTTSPTNKLNVTFTWDKGIELGSGIALYYVSIGTKEGGDDIQKEVQINTTTFNQTFKAAGTYYIKVKAADVVGHIGEWSKVGSVVIDQVAPTLNVGNLEEAPIINTTESTISGQAGDVNGVDKVLIKIDNGDWAQTDTTNNYDLWQYVWKNYAEGIHTIIVKAVDKAGNEITSSASTITVDYTAPTIPADLRAFNIGNPTQKTYAAYLDFAGSIDAVSGVKTYEIYRDSQKIAEVSPLKDASNPSYTSNSGQSYFYLDSNLLAQTYTYQIKAIDGVGNTSSASEIKVDTTGASIQSNTINELKAIPSSLVTKDKTAAIISWKTTYPATSLVEYGTTTNYGQKSDIDANLNQGHSVLLSNLRPGTVYHAKVTSRDVYGREQVSDDVAFTTKVAVDQKNLIQVIIDALQNLLNTLSAGKVHAAESDQADLHDLQSFSDNLMLTDLSFKDKDFYQFVLSYPKDKDLFKSTDGKNYQKLSSSNGFYVDSVQNDQTLYYKVGDGQPIVRKPLSGNLASLAITDQDIVKDSIFTTEDKVGLTVYWKTNKGATSQVEFGPNLSYGQKTKADESLNTGHNVTIENLSPDTVYHFKVSSKDNQGNLVSSEDFTYKTPTALKQKTILDYLLESLQRTLGIFKR